eukprot:11811400-Prorocentrum_lima.AAC.1
MQGQFGQLLRRGAEPPPAEDHLSCIRLVLVPEWQGPRCEGGFQEQPCIHLLCCNCCGRFLSEELLQHGGQELLAALPEAVRWVGVPILRAVGVAVDGVWG